MPREKVSSSLKHADLISRVQDRLCKTKCIPQPIHVHGHMDDKSRKPLTLLEKLNIRMDTLAKQIMSQARSQNICSLPQLPSSDDGLPIVTLHNTPLPTKLSSELKDGISTLELKEWWIEKKRFKVQDDPYIDWAAMVYCMRNCGSRYKRFIPKWVSGQIAVGKVMQYRKARVHNRCPRCNAFMEDTTHVLRCQTRRTIQHWEILVNRLSDWMKKVDTSPAISISLCAMLKYWRRKRDSNHYIDPDWSQKYSSGFSPSSVSWLA